MKARTPIIAALQRHSDKQPLSFHVPGHKNGAVWPESLAPFQHVLAYDVTELEGLDDLHDPTGPIAESQALCAAFYGAGETSYLVGGSTSGNLAMIYGLCKEGDVVFVQRNCHKSVLHALELARAKVVFLAPEYDKKTGRPLGLTANVFEEALRRYPGAKALVATYPDYWGTVRNQAAIFAQAKEAGLLVLVDEAHGAHFKLGEGEWRCPKQALDMGADVVVQSAHKMLPALTMGAWLHFAKETTAAIREPVKRALTMVQSSSPSYLLLASLDGARAYIESEGEAAFAKACRASQRLQEAIGSHPMLEVVENAGECYQNDPLKVTIKANDSRSGTWLLQELAKAGIWAEMADPNAILLVLGVGQDFDASLFHSRLSTRCWQPEKQRKKGLFQAGAGPLISELIDMKRPDFSSETVPLSEAVGRVAAEPLVPYPPGVPLLYRGEQVAPAHVKQIEQLLEASVRFQGLDPKHGLRVQMPED